MKRISEVNRQNLKDAIDSMTGKQWHVEVLPKIPMILITETDNEGNYYVAEYTEDEIDRIRLLCRINGWTYKIGFDRGNYVSYIEIREK